MAEDVCFFRFPAVWIPKAWFALRYKYKYKHKHKHKQNERKKQLKSILSVASTFIVEKEINRSW